jgi:hypothetical protein
VPALKFEGRAGADSVFRSVETVTGGFFRYFQQGHARCKYENNESLTNSGYPGEGVDFGATRTVGVALGGGGGSSSSTLGEAFGVGDSRWFVLRLLFDPKLPLTVVAGSCSAAFALPRRCAESATAMVVTGCCVRFHRWPGSSAEPVGCWDPPPIPAGSRLHSVLEFGHFHA